MTHTTSTIGVPIRSGVHTGELEFVGDDIRGVAVHLAARVLAMAASNEVMVSATTAALLEGSGLLLEDFRPQELKGISGPRHVFRVVGSPAR